MTLRSSVVLIAAYIAASSSAFAQPLGQPDRDAPGDEMIQAYLAAETTKLEATFPDDLKSLADWQTKRPEYIEQYYYMLGLSPWPDKSPLAPTVTGTLKGDGYEVDMIHYQSVPQLYVTGNLYRPAKVKEGEKLPAVFYVCGHSGRGRNGNKVAYQSHGIWFARHGYICLVVDSLQLGEIAAIHHGTYNLQRWWWHSRGYTPAGVEAWNGVRGIDYLVSRPDVDPLRIAVTGISGGGAATFWVAAADERVKVAVPVSGMADLESYVPNRVINGHCDCMFLYNTYQWPWTRIAGLVAPRPMLFINSDKDAIFPMDANDRIINRLERTYGLYGKGNDVDSVVSVGGHAYRQDIRQAAYVFINTHLKGDPRHVTDSERDIVTEGGNPGPYPIPPEKLRVFPNDGDLPRDQLNTKIDESFVPLAKIVPPVAGKFAEWKAPLLKQLRGTSFRYFPESIPAAKKLKDIDAATERLTSEENIQFELRYPAGKAMTKSNTSKGILLVVLGEEDAGKTPDWLKDVNSDGKTIVLCEPRGIGATRWTRKNGPNYVERSHALLGRTVDTGRVWDIIAAAKYLAAQTKSGDTTPLIHVAGQGPAGLLAAYAAVLDDQIAGVTLLSPSNSLMEKDSPQFLSALRTCDVKEALQLIAPRPLRLIEPR
ncbi:MAG: prolyl oligopeptidase family serine peptidase [Pirellulaceae bacterium]|nr:prolyl oligopeptidase family serine peptidase [Pirellulaceae bacterium]